MLNLNWFILRRDYLFLAWKKLSLKFHWTFFFLIKKDGNAPAAASLNGLVMVFSMPPALSWLFWNKHRKLRKLAIRVQQLGSGRYAYLLFQFSAPLLRTHGALTLHMFLMRVGDKRSSKLEATGWVLPLPLDSIWSCFRQAVDLRENRTTSSSTRPQKVLDSYPADWLVQKLPLTCRAGIRNATPSTCVGLSRPWVCCTGITILCSVTHFGYKPRGDRTMSVTFSTLSPASGLILDRG